MGRWGLFATLLIAALPAAAIGYQLFTFITSHSGNARTLHQVIAYGTGVVALVVLGLPILPLVQKSGGAGAAKSKKKGAEPAAAAGEDEMFGEAAAVESGELAEVGSGEIEELGSGEIVEAGSDEFVEVSDADSGDVFEDVLEEDDDAKK